MQYDDVMRYSISSLTCIFMYNVNIRYFVATHCVISSIIADKIRLFARGYAQFDQ